MGQSLSKPISVIGATTQRVGVTMPASPLELLARGRRLRDELREWLLDLMSLPAPSPSGTVCEQSPGWLLWMIHERMRQLLDGVDVQRRVPCRTPAERDELLSSVQVGRSLVVQGPSTR